MSHATTIWTDSALGTPSIAACDTTANRRIWERYAVAEDQAWLGWWEGRVYRKSPAIMLDISEGGARLVAETAPPRRATVWVCIAGRHKTEWIEASVLGVSRDDDGSSVIRMAFREACPYAFFEVAVYGYPAQIELTPTRQPVEACPTDPSGRDWW